MLLHAHLGTVQSHAQATRLLQRISSLSPPLPFIFHPACTCAILLTTATSLMAFSSPSLELGASRSDQNDQLPTSFGNITVIAATIIAIDSNEANDAVDVTVSKQRSRSAEGKRGSRCVRRPENQVCECVRGDVARWVDDVADPINYDNIFARGGFLGPAYRSFYPRNFCATFRKKD